MNVKFCNDLTMALSCNTLVCFTPSGITRWAIILFIMIAFVQVNLTLQDGDGVFHMNPASDVCNQFTGLIKQQLVGYDVQDNVKWAKQLVGYDSEMFE